MGVVGSTAVIEMTPDSYCVKFIDLSWISWIVHLSSTCNSWCSEDMRYPPVQLMGRRGKRFALGQLTMMRRKRRMIDCRVMGH